MKKTATKTHFLLNVLLAVFFFSPVVVSANFQVQFYQNNNADVFSGTLPLTIGADIVVSTTTPIDNISFFIKDDSPGSSAFVDFAVYSGVTTYCEWQYYNVPVNLSLIYIFPPTTLSYCSLPPGTYHTKMLMENGSAFTTRGIASTTEPYFLISSGGAPLPQTRYSVSPIDTGISTSSVNSLCNSNFATSTGFTGALYDSFSLSLCRVNTFLFVPSSDSLNQFGTIVPILQTKIPFSYFYEATGIFSGQSASTSANFIPLSVDLRSTGVASTSPYQSFLPSGSFAYLSSSTISAYVSPTLYDTLFILMRGAIWITVLFHLYGRIRPRHVAHV